MIILMRLVRLALTPLLFLCWSITGTAQGPRRVALPDVTFTYEKPDKYHWEKVCEIKNRILFANTIICSDSIVYSFGGFDTLHLHREMNILDGGRFSRSDNIRYPGRGFMYNICFLKDSFLYIGGGLDSNMSRYAERDFWKYNLHTGLWTRLKDLPFYYRFGTGAYSYQGQTFIYIPVLSGKDFEKNVHTFYSYDETGDTWNRLNSESPDTDFQWPVSFRIAGDIYVLFQQHGRRPGNALKQFYKFSLATRQWTPLAELPGSPRDLAFAFSDDHYGYVGGGGTSGAYFTRNVYRYDPNKDYWAEIREFPRYIRRAIGWRFKGESYVGFGINEETGTVGIWKLKADK